MLGGGLEREWEGKNLPNAESFEQCTWPGVTMAVSLSEAGKGEDWKRRPNG